MAGTVKAVARTRPGRPSSARRSKTVREALNDWTELVDLEEDLARVAAAEAAFSRRLLQQYAVEAAAAGDAPAARLLAAIGHTHERAERELRKAIEMATNDRRARPRRATSRQRRRLP